MPDNSCSIEVTPLAQSQPINQSTIFNLNYTCQDFWSLKSRLVDYIRQVFPDRFNDFVESDLAIMLIENQAFIADLLSFKIDQIANEPFIDTVTELANAFRICKLVGFTPQPPIASSSMWQATIQNPLPTDLVITAPVAFQVASSGAPLNIELYPADASNNPIYNQDIVIPSGNIQNFSIVGLEGRTYTENLIGTGAISQTLALAFHPVIWDSVQVQVDGVLWNQVDFFTDSQRRLEYRVEYDSNWNAFVIFGNNRAGMIPSQGSKIVLTYRVGGGTRGNIVTGFVQQQRVIALDGFDYSVPVTFRNYTSGQFGYDGDTIDDIRRKLPAYLRTQNRCVTGLDYKTQAELFATPYNGQIGKATAVLRNYGCAGNVVDLYVLANGLTTGSLATASNELKVALQDKMEDLKMFTDFLCIRDGTVLLVDTTIDVTLDKFYRKFEDQIRGRITTRLNTFYGLPNWDYGQTLKDSDIIKALSDISEVQSYDISFVTNDDTNGGAMVTSRFNEIIRPDNTTIAFMYI